ncbi:MAG: aminoglycoside phosphotransferase family protein [Acidimicrobiales bacterium]|nr:aminoglycoside phosphotransferase family protein [Acidimicrobiales bacterium]
MARLRLNEIVTRKIAMLGDVGAGWLENLDEIVNGYATAWGFTIGESLDGGSHAYVAEVVRHDGTPAVFKYALPDMRGAGDHDKELRTVVAAQGNGYVHVFDYDLDNRAVLMERLGPTLDQSGLSVAEQIEVMCRTLSPWAAAPDGLTIESGAEKAAWLHKNIEQMWNELDRPCSRAAVDQAQLFATQRIAAHDPSKAVLVHGDAHQSNLLLAADGSYRMIDPDPMIAEPAADLAVPMRDWNADLRASGDPAGAAVARCYRISELTGVDPQPIWEWGFMERMSTALYCDTLGIEDWPRDGYPVVEACVGVATV